MEKLSKKENKTKKIPTALSRKFHSYIDIRVTGCFSQFALVFVVHTIGTAYGTRCWVIPVVRTFLWALTAGVAAIRGRYTPSPETALLVSTRVVLLYISKKPLVQLMFCLHTTLQVYLVNPLQFNSYIYSIALHIKYSNHIFRLYSYNIHSTILNSFDVYSITRQLQ